MLRVISPVWMAKPSPSPRQAPSTMGSPRRGGGVEVTWSVPSVTAPPHPPLERVGGDGEGRRLGGSGTGEGGDGLPARGGPAGATPRRAPPRATGTTSWSWTADRWRRRRWRRHSRRPPAPGRAPPSPVGSAAASSSSRSHPTEKVQAFCKDADCRLTAGPDRGSLGGDVAPAPHLHPPAYLRRAPTRCSPRPPVPSGQEVFFSPCDTSPATAS
jgi:hypothetical protein